MSLGKFLGVAVSLAALCGCAATETAKERSVFLRANLAETTYGADLTACDGYVAQKAASGGERGAAVAFSFLLGGIVGAAAADSSYRKSQNRLFEECMFSKGYALVTLPAGYGADPRDEAGDFDRRQAGLDLVQANQAEELVVWENAKNIGSQERILAYLRAYPNGRFAAQAKNLLAGNTPKNAKPK